MSKTARVVNLLAVVLPPILISICIVLFWDEVVGISDLVVLFAMDLITGYGVTVGFHRMLTHRSFRTSKPVESLFAVLGTLSVQGPVISWVADHRKHHAHTDVEGDPHSPHVGRGAGLRGALGGLVFAHMGWLMETQGRADRRKYAPDLYEDQGMRWISRHFVALIVAGLALPAAIGFAATGTLKGAATALLWGGFVRVFLLHHVTWSINSVCHFMGTRRFDVDDESRNVFWLALPSLGEAWHHNHHAFPRAAVHGLKRFELDPTGWIVRGMKRAGLAWDVVEIGPERQAQKLAGARAQMSRAA